MTDPVHGCNIDAVGDGVSALNDLPGLALCFSELSLFMRVPADCRGVKQNGGSLQGGETGSLRIPLIPADQRADLSDCRIEGFEADVAGGEVEFFVVRRG